ncbi:MAG: diguanylate cyclase [Xenococcaceae cyanobacterium]
MNFNQEMNIVNKTALNLLGLAETELKELEELLDNKQIKDDLNASILDLSRLITTQEDPIEYPQIQEKTPYGTYYDRLSGLPNQNSFTEQLQEIIISYSHKKENPFAVVVLDLDNFREINDSFGYYLGDRLLVAIAQRLQQCVRSSDLVARLEGDEFAILLKNINSIQISEKIAYRIQDELSFPFYLIGEEVALTASLGITLSSSNNYNPVKLLSNAKIALCQAKALGRDSFVVLE